MSDLKGLLSTPEICKERGLSFLRSYGFKADDWFVCIHIREREDGSFRNSKIKLYIDAIHEITRRGGWVVRIGNNHSIPLPNMERVIDYSQISNQSHFLDTFFLAECLFSIQTTSGPSRIPILYGKPLIQADWFPIRHTVQSSKDIFIPKLIYSNKLQRLLTFSELFTSDISFAEFSSI